MRHFSRIASLIVVLIAMLSLGAQAQTSLGYSEPADISTLLDYRLPDWSYRIWDADFHFNGAGEDSRSLGDSRSSASTSLQLGSSFFQAWENEKTYRSIAADVDGNYRRNNYSTSDSEQRSHRLAGDYSWHGQVHQFLGTGPFSVRASGGSGHSYVEHIMERREFDSWEDDNSYRREGRLRLAGGLGWGRLRNVEPMLRAQRLSERLVSLGRAPLTTAQLHEVAAVWSQLTGYFETRDRYNRYLWDDVLTPMLDPDKPLTAYEILYLMDVMREQLGDRHQGVEVVAEVGYTESSNSGTDDRFNYRARIPRLRFDVFHNLTLTQQVHFGGAYSYAWSNSNDFARDRGSASLRLAHLWNLTDRYRLDTSMSFRGDSDIQAEYRAQRGDVRSAFFVYLEDQLSLNASVSASYNRDKNADGVAQSWRWTYGVGLVYHLDRAMF